MITQKNHQNRITSFQLVFIISGSQIGVGILSLYRVVFEAGAGQDAWISVIIAGAFAQTAIFLMVHLASKFPDETIIDYSQKLLGTWLGWLLSAFFLVYLLLVAASVSRGFAMVLKTWALHENPIELLVIFTLLPSAYIVLNGIKVLARFTLAVYMLTFWLIVFLLFPLHHGDILNILPLGKTGVFGILSGALAASFAMVGIELIFLLYPFADRKRDVLIGASIGNALTTIAYTFTVITSAIFFSPGDIANQMWPTLQLLKIIQFSFFQRIEGLVLALWMLLIVVTVAVYHWGCTYSLYRLFKLKSYKTSLTITTILILISALLPEGFIRLFEIMGILGLVGVGLVIPLPIVLIMIFYLRKGIGSIK